jgi:hypothetical protein
VRVLSFLLRKRKETKESRLKKKLQFFRGGATVGDSATALPG